MKVKMPRKIEISHRTIIFTVAFLGIIWLVIRITDIILAVFVSVLLMTALKPVVDFLTRFKIPRILAILLSFILLFTLVGWGLAGILPPLIDQTTNLVNRFPILLTQITTWVNGLGITEITPEVLSGQISQLGAIPGNIVSVLLAFLSN